MTTTPQRGPAATGHGAGHGAGRSEVSPELAQAVVAALLRIKEELGELPAREVRRAHEVLGGRVSQRTLWRWVQRGQVPQFRRTPYTVNAEDRERLLRCGSVAEFHRQLDAKGEASVSERTMQRAFQREFGTVDMTFIRSGFDAARDIAPTSAMPERAVNEEWSMDDTQLPVWCIMPGGAIAKPQMQAIRDAATRLILTLNISPYVFTTEDAVENIASAVAGRYTENGVFVGGKPGALRTDRGSIFLARATSLGLVAEKIARRYSAPYEPQGNGGIERWHRTIKALFKDVPGYDWSDYKKGDRRKVHEPPPTEQLLHFEEVVAIALRKVHAYNTERVHSTHGMTPQECWERDVAENPGLVKRADGVALRAAMRQSVTRTLRRRRIEWEKRFYDLHPQSVGAPNDPDDPDDPDEADEAVARRAKRIRETEGKEVSVRFLTGRVEFVSVYTSSGDYLGDAVWEKLQTPEQAGETSAERRRHIKTMKADIEAIAVADAEAVARSREAALAEAGIVDYDQYDEPVAGVDFDPVTGEVLDGPAGRTSPDVATPGRKHRSSKAGGHATNSNAKPKGHKKKGAASSQPTPAQRREEQRRRDAAEAAELVQRRNSA